MQNRLFTANIREISFDRFCAIFALTLKDETAIKENGSVKNGLHVFRNFVRECLLKQANPTTILENGKMVENRNERIDHIDADYVDTVINSIRDTFKFGSIKGQPEPVLWLETKQNGVFTLTNDCTVDIGNGFSLSVQSDKPNSKGFIPLTFKGFYNGMKIRQTLALPLPLFCREINLDWVKIFDHTLTGLQVWAPPSTDLKVRRNYKATVDSFADRMIGQGLRGFALTKAEADPKNGCFEVLASNYIAETQKDFKTVSELYNQILKWLCD